MKYGYLSASVEHLIYGFVVDVDFVPGGDTISPILCQAFVYTKLRPRKATDCRSRVTTFTIFHGRIVIASTPPI